VEGHSLFIFPHRERRPANENSQHTYLKRIDEAHKKRHRSLLSKCGLISRKFSAGYLPTREILDFIVTDLIADHLRKDDVIFSAGLSNNSC